jgi:nitrate reductase (cytochrome)
MTVLDRRGFLRRNALASAFALVPGSLSAKDWWPSQEEITWSKAPCRFCGVGCGLLIGVRDGQAVGVRGDPDSDVNRGLCCVKGYHSIQALYGRDRLSTARVRRNGRLGEVSIAAALDVVSQRLQETLDEYGPDSVAIYGSGQWTVADGYAAVKLFKAGLGSNNVEANSRLSLGGAISGSVSTFGLDEPPGCYEDIDHADVFVLWGTNMAETYPVLFSRILERRRTDPKVRIIDLSTRTTRTSYASDRSLLFRPQTDLALANAICYEIIRNDWVNEDFVRDHVTFRSGETGLGYGLQSGNLVIDEGREVTRNHFEDFLEDYTPDSVAEISGLPADEIRYLAYLYGDSAKKVVSFWSSGVNQHVRSCWMNNLIYNVHLLVGKISQPGNSPFSLTGQASGCGTVREVGTFSDRLPSGSVQDEGARDAAAEVWQVPVEEIAHRPPRDAMEMFRALERGEIRFLWAQGTNPMVSLPNLDRYREAIGGADCFLVVSDVYPTPTTDVADVILPSTLWIEREGIFGNGERRTQHWSRVVDAPGECMSDSWQIIEVAKRMGRGDLFPWSEEDHVREIWREYSRFHDTPSDRMATYEDLLSRSGVMWPVVDGRETRWRYNAEFDPAADRSLGFDFYGNSDHRARIWIRPYEPAAEETDEDFPLVLSSGRVLEQSQTGSLSRRIRVLHRAMPKAYVEINSEDAQRLGIRDHDMVRLTTRRGSLDIEARVDYRGQPAPGQVFVPFFDEGLRVNELTLDAVGPLSGGVDFKKGAVRVERIRGVRVP